jgi:hypothetical protein
MKKCFVTLTMCVLLGTGLSAQSIFFELGGPGLASFNFDTRFSPENDGLGGRIGFGGASVDGAGISFIPVGLNYLLGKDNRNYFEIGLGGTIVLGGDGDGDNFSETFGYLNFGYRLQPADGGFQFRAFMSPVFGSGFFIPYWGGLSFGYSF